MSAHRTRILSLAVSALAAVFIFAGVHSFSQDKAKDDAPPDMETHQKSGDEGAYILPEEGEEVEEGFLEGDPDRPVGMPPEDASAEDYLVAYFEALQEEFPPGGDGTASMASMMGSGAEIAERFFPENKGRLGRALTQSLAQFALFTPESWEMIDINDRGEDIEITVEFVVGNSSMTRMGMNSRVMRFTLQKQGDSWILASVDADD